MKSHALAAVIAVLLGGSLAFRRWHRTTRSRNHQPTQRATPTHLDRLQLPTARLRHPPTIRATRAARRHAPKETHDKGKNDIDDIGNRKVGSTGKSLGDWYSIDTDVKLGKQYAMMVE